MSLWERKMRLGPALAICVTAAFLFAPASEALAQQPAPKARVSMLCKTSAGGPGFVLVTLSNLTTSTIPKGQTLFAKKLGNYPLLGRAAAKRIPHAKLIEFPGLGHAPQIQAPDRFHEALLKGLNEK